MRITIGNRLHRTLGALAPQLLRGKSRDLFETTAGVVVFIYINFALRGRRIRATSRSCWTCRPSAP
jgi:hypothetical protein